MSSAVLRSVDHLIVGGGPAGSMAALRLASAGRNVVLLERESGPHHKVCGEFLSREAVAYLHQAGIVALGLGAATIGSLRLSAGSKVITASLPFQALSLSRRVLDEALLARARNKLAAGFFAASPSNRSLRKQMAGSSRSATAPPFARPRFSSPLASTTSVASPALPPNNPTSSASRCIGGSHPRKSAALARLHGPLSLPRRLRRPLAHRRRRRQSLPRRAPFHSARALAVGRNFSPQSCAETATCAGFSTEQRPLWPRPLAISPIPYGYLSPGIARTLVRRRSGRRHSFVHRRRHLHRPAQRRSRRANVPRRT